MLVTGLLARNRLQDVQDDVARVRQLVATGHIAEAHAMSGRVQDDANTADWLTSGPAWWMTAHVPWAGRPAVVARGTTDAAQRLGAQALPRLLDIAQNVDPAHLRAKGDTIRLGPLLKARPDLASAARTVDAAARTIDGLPHSSWLPQIDHARGQFADQLGLVRGYVDAAARATQALPTLLGRSSPQRYFIALENEAEMRGTGGLPGAFAIAVVHSGTITFTHFKSDSALLPAASGRFVPTGLDFGPQYDALYGSDRPTASYLDSNLSPDFPYAAQIWADMWQKISGEHVDGALAVDPTALSYFLRVTGPAALSGQRVAVVAAQNVVPLTERDEYALYPDTGQRRAFNVAVLRATAHRITSGAGAALQLLGAASRSARQHRLLVWTRNTAVERLVRQTDYSGALPPASRPLAGVVLNNAASGKLDYYVTRSLSYQRIGCGSRRDLDVTIRLANSAPASGLPPYVTARSDSAAATSRPGDTRSLLDYYATGGALLESVQVDGHPSTAAAYRIDGHTVFRLDLELPRGTTRTVELLFTEPAGRGDPVIWRQPGVAGLAVTEFDQSCD